MDDVEYWRTRARAAERLLRERGISVDVDDDDDESVQPHWAEEEGTSDDAAVDGDFEFTKRQLAFIHLVCDKWMAPGRSSEEEQLDQIHEERMVNIFKGQALQQYISKRRYPSGRMQDLNADSIAAMIDLDDPSEVYHVANCPSEDAQRRAVLEAIDAARAEFDSDAEFSDDDSESDESGDSDESGESDEGTPEHTKSRPPAHGPCMA